MVPKTCSAKQQLCTCMKLFCTFLCRFCSTMTCNCHILRRLEDVNRQPFSISVLNLDTVIFRIQPLKISTIFNKLTDME